MKPRMLLITDKRTGAQLLTPSPYDGYPDWPIERWESFTYEDGGKFNDSISKLMGTRLWVVQAA